MFTDALFLAALLLAALAVLTWLEFATSDPNDLDDYQ